MLASQRGMQPPTDEETALHRNANLVKKIAHHLIARLPSSVLLDDLIQSGMIGLLEAWRNYDASKGASFETYAGIRIKGAMLDEIRRNDWTPRSVHRNTRMVMEAMHQVELSEEREAKPIEIASKLGISMEEYQRILQDTHNSRIFPLDEFDSIEILSVQSPAENQPLDNIQKEDLSTKIAYEINRLPEKEKIVFSLYYKEECNLKEIGTILGVSESRACQLHSQGMLRLQSRIQHNNRGCL